MAVVAASSPDALRREGDGRGDRLMRTASLLVFLLGTLRVFALVLHSPVLGYANNFDMVRTQACLQVWPADPGIAPGSPTFSGPLDRYRLADVPQLRGLCVPGPDLLFGYLGRVVVRASGQGTFSIRVFGTLRAAALAILAFAFLLHVLRRATPMEALVHALVYSLVVADPANTLYANTFYREFSVVLFAYASLLFLWSVCRLGPGPFKSPALAVSLLLLGLSSRQHLLFPVAVLAGLLAATRFQRRPFGRTVALVVLAGLLAAAGQAELFRRLGSPGTHLHSVEFANATDTFLGAVLPAADDPVEAARTLGLPARCAEHRGETWYTPGLQANHPCPEVLQVSRLRILALAFDQPAFLPRVTREGLFRLRPWTLRYVGSVEGEVFGYAGRLAGTLSDGIDLLPQWSVTLLLLLSIPFGIGGLAIARCAGAGPASRSGAIVVLVLAFSLWVVFYSALFGDGTHEFQKHVHLLPSLLLSLLVLVPFVFGGALSRASGTTSRGDP